MLSCLEINTNVHRITTKITATSNFVIITIHKINITNAPKFMWQDSGTYKCEFCNIISYLFNCVFLNVKEAIWFHLLLSRTYSLATNGVVCKYTHKHINKSSIFKNSFHWFVDILCSSMLVVLVLLFFLGFMYYSVRNTEEYSCKSP